MLKEQYNKEINMSWYKESQIDQINQLNQSDKNIRNNIKPNDPVRKDIANLLKNIYWEKPGKALSEISNTLANHGYALISIPSFNDRQPDGRFSYILGKSGDTGNPFNPPVEVDNMLIFSWHWLAEPGASKCEVTAYIS